MTLIKYSIYTCHTSYYKSNYYKSNHYKSNSFIKKYKSENH